MEKIPIKHLFRITQMTISATLKLFRKVFSLIVFFFGYKLANTKIRFEITFLRNMTHFYIFWKLYINMRLLDYYVPKQGVYLIPRAILKRKQKKNNIVNN